MKCIKFPRNLIVIDRGSFSHSDKKCLCWPGFVGKLTPETATMHSLSTDLKFLYRNKNQLLDVPLQPLNAWNSREKRWKPLFCPSLFWWLSLLLPYTSLVSFPVPDFYFFISQNVIEYLVLLERVKPEKSSFIFRWPDFFSVTWSVKQRALRHTAFLWLDGNSPQIGRTTYTNYSYFCQ